MRSFMTENTLAAVCYLGSFPTLRIQSISNADLWSVYAPRFGLTARGVDKAAGLPMQRDFVLPCAHVLFLFFLFSLR